jgi:predicted nucleic acid-binding protein
MKRFADTFYFMALLNRNDSAHAAAAVAHSDGPQTLVTTEWTLTELADAMCSRRRRQEFVKLYRVLASDPAIEIIGASSGLFSQGIELYATRPDKDWSLTDCISFVVMKERGVTDALTGDHQFEQAGFRALLS